MPTRNRTPWDAGGYSLPINTRSASFTDSIYYSDSPIKSPHDSYHRPSDSHSSISSFSSSVNSAPHSRFSSTSTVSGFHRLSSITTDDSFTNQRHERCSSRSVRSPLSAVSPSTVTLLRNIDLSSSQPLEALAQITEGRPGVEPREDSGEMTRRRSELDDVRPVMKADARTKSVSYLDAQRPASPSDAILIRRTSHPDEVRIIESLENSST
jgi:hypothetical protein